MTTSDKNALVEAVERLASDWTTVASLMKRCLTPDETQDATAEEKPTAPEKTYTYEEARAVLAEKSRTGFRAEVKAILTKHGVAQLSDVKDPNTLAAIVAEAEEIKVG